MKKIFIIGAGSVGSAVAFELSRLGRYKTYLFDINTGLAFGKTLDISQAIEQPAEITKSASLLEAISADLIIITAGSARRKGMGRDELFEQNNIIVDGIIAKIAEFGFNKPILIVTNPSEMLVYSAKIKKPKLNIFGLGCVLDSWRIRRFIAEALKTNANNIQANVIGMHNDSMVPLINSASFNGIPIKDFLDSSTIDKIIYKTKHAGTEIVDAIGTHSGFFAAGRAISELSMSIVDGKNSIYPLSVVCNGEYGFTDVCLALPAVYSNTGIEIVEFSLSEEEQASLTLCAERMKKSLEMLGRVSGSF